MYDDHIDGTGYAILCAAYQTTRYLELYRSGYVERRHATAS